MGDQLTADWIGFLTVGACVRTIALSGELTAGHEVEFALPDERVHRLTMVLAEAEDRRLSGEVIARGETIRISGCTEENTFIGTCETASGAGSVDLHRIAVLELAEYRALSRRYEFGGRRMSIHLNGDEWVGTPVLFYAERNRFVRLYADTAHRLLSEAGEIFVLTEDRRSIESMSTRLHPSEAVTVDEVPGWLDEEVRIDGPGGQLCGTLMLPLEPGPHPAIVMVHGAAGGRRDYYRAFAEQFTQCGVAALAYDRRGWGESSGDKYPSFGEKADDASAWLEYLRSRPDIDPDRVGIWGYSNGSWVAPLVAARNTHAAFVCVIGASGMTAVETEIHRRAFDLNEQGVPSAQIEWVCQMWRIIYDVLQGRPSSVEDEQRFDDLAGKVRDSTELSQIIVQEYAKQSPFLGSLPPYATYRELLAELPNHAADSDEWTCDPVDSYRQVSRPVLFLVGADDSNLPALESAKRVGRALEQAGNHDHIVVVFANTGHGLNAGRADSIGMSDEEAAYRLHDFRFVGGYRELIRQWVDTRITGSALREPW